MIEKLDVEGLDFQTEQEKTEIVEKIHLGDNKITKEILSEFNPESTSFDSCYFLRPVRRAAMFPTLRPGGACLLTVLGLPGDWCEPPPCG